jgi:hypothetical protein
MDVTIYPDPNPALTEILKSGRMREIVSGRANLARDLYQALVAHRTGELAGSARASTEIGGVDLDRWIGVLTVGTDHVLPHEFGRGEHPGSIKNLDGDEVVQQAAHDLNRVLEELGGL